MKKVIYFVLITMFMQVNLAVAASNLEEGVKQLAEQISKNMQEKQSKKIAIIDFSDLNGNVTALGQFMAEELTTQLFMIAPGKFEVVERRQLLKLVEELSLGQMGLIEEKSLKEMGRVLGVDAIVTGSMTDLGNTVKINSRMIAVESAKVVAVAAAEIQKTGVIADLLKKQSVQSSPAKTTTSKTVVQKVEDRNFIFELMKLNISGSSVSCELIITRKNRDRNLYIDGGMYYKPSTRMFDDLGNEYKVSTIQLGSREGGKGIGLAHGVEQLLVSGVPIKARLDFENVSRQANSITVIEIQCSEGDYSTAFKIQFRNIPLSG